ncbi:MAG: pyridoxal phosphate-dependent aminotransferase [Acidobacteria bacterium]|nr:pyridoxal phosphate-dependent aminotransferase [Acidobacteriota bacterium]
MFSTRLPASLVPTPLAAAMAGRRARPDPILDLTVSNPTTVGVAYPETLTAPWSNAAGLRYEPDPRGLRFGRQAVTGWYAAMGEPGSPDDLILTASTSEAYSHLFKLLCNPGDSVLVPCPSYPLFEHLAQLDAVTVERYTCRDAGRWVLDEVDLAARIMPRTRALIVVAPNNPTGSVPTPDEWDVLTDTCRRHGLALIVDEVFADYPLGGRDRFVTPISSDVLTFRLNGLSKLVGLPQAKLGWIRVSGGDTRRRAALDALEVIADTYLSVSTPVQLAVPALLEQGALVRQQIQARLAGNLALITARLAGSAFDVRVPDGGWSVVLRVPEVADAATLVLALLERGVLVHPGYFYDLPHDGYLVVSLLTPAADLRQGLDVLCTLPLLQFT